MDTGFKKLHTDIVNLKQGQSLSMPAIQRFKKNLKLERLIDTRLERNSKVKQVL